MLNMKKSLSLPISAIVTILIFSFIFISFAQEEEKETGYAWGVVKSISSGQVVLTEQDEETGKEADVTYYIDPKVEFNNASKIEDIAAGNSIGIEYEVSDGDKIAKIIDAEELFQQEGAAATKTCE
ncbi:MAG: hypothetical protein PHG69_02070 [Candidatus Omnitrophica bacterium]|nr:hypothetical protein [Candidatus Omnitrophota bacterium]